MGSCQLAGSKLVSSNTHLVPGGECGLEGGEGAAGDGLGGVLGEEGGDEPVEDGGGQRRRKGANSSGKPWNPSSASRTARHCAGEGEAWVG